MSAVKCLNPTYRVCVCGGDYAFANKKDLLR